MKKTTIDSQEVAKFAQHATEWWNPDGPLKTLHDINPARLGFIQKFTTLSQQKILDVGCGGGILCEGMVKEGGVVTGLDVGTEAIESARLHASQQELDIHYVCQPVEEYTVEHLFDVVTCMEMLEHVSEPQLVIDHCVRLLKPGGYLFLSTINRSVTAYATIIVAAEYILNLLPRQTHDFEKFIKPSELASLTRTAGLETAGIAGLAYNPLTRTAALRDSVTANYLLACRKPIPN